jgi:hypothetical protein
MANGRHSHNRFALLPSVNPWVDRIGWRAVVIAGLTRNSWLQLHGCRIKSGMTRREQVVLSYFLSPLVDDFKLKTMNG